MTRVVKSALEKKIPAGPEWLWQGFSMMRKMHLLDHHVLIFLLRHITDDARGRHAVLK